MNILGHYIFTKHRGIFSSQLNIYDGFKAPENTKKKQKLSVVFRGYNAVNYFRKKLHQRCSTGF